MNIFFFEKFLALDVETNSFKHTIAVFVVHNRVLILLGDLLESCS